MKAVLVIDMPKSCFDCQLMVDGWCYAVKADRTQDTISAKDRTCWCPLRPLPQKLEVKVDTFDDIMHTEFQMTDVIADKLIANIRFETDKLVALGYNACLDDITGETE